MWIVALQLLSKYGIPSFNPKLYSPPTIPDSDEFIPPSEGYPIPTGTPTTGATSEHIDTPSQSTPMDDNSSPTTTDPPAPHLRRSTRIQVPTQDFLDSVAQEQLDFSHQQDQPTQEFFQALDQNTMTNSDIVPQTIAFNASRLIIKCKKNLLNRFVF